MISPTSQRTAKSELRRWCPEAKTHQDADDPWCGWWHDDTTGRHRLRLRQMLVCSTCGQGYFKQEDFNEHECHSAY